jgi:hypothetical protein
VGKLSLIRHSYRDALKLEPECFSASFEIANVHVDTPRQGYVWQPRGVSSGGALVTRHFDWSASAATHFFSDVEHEVLPVTSGHQITLTYNLSIVRGMKAASWDW